MTTDAQPQPQPQPPILIIKVDDLILGNTIYDLVPEMLRLAKLLNVEIEYTFNGFCIWVRPTTEPMDVYRRYQNYLQI